LKGSLLERQVCGALNGGFCTKKENFKEGKKNVPRKKSLQSKHEQRKKGAKRKKKKKFLSETRRELKNFKKGKGTLHQTVRAGKGKNDGTSEKGKKKVEWGHGRKRK